MFVVFLCWCLIACAGCWLQRGMCDLFLRVAVVLVLSVIVAGLLLDFTLF